MKKIGVVVFIVLFLAVAILPQSAYAGWKETYKAKYSKKQLDPNSEKAKKIKRLANMDFNFLKWHKTPEERKALGLGEAKTSLSEHFMPWKRRGEEVDKFEGYSTNYSARESELPEKSEGKVGRTLTGTIKNFGKTLGDTIADEGGKVKDRVRQAEVK